MIRKWMAVAMCALVPAALLASPLVHAHHDGHPGAVLHSHLDSHHVHAPHPDGPVLERDGDDHEAVFFTAFAGASSAAFAVAVPATEPAVITPLPSVIAPVSDVRTHGHDPPLDETLAPRAPPARLS